ncbi:hypothetical protein [Sphingobium sp. AP50]|uniref:hypothetical protein n=1 Tax=Sphingobium sp. AP50 TaxID=1884369 RepID=UPI000B87134A|nr:hypothetical protein [Sphingobium sp. AP50]
MELRQNQLRRREAATEIFTSLETFEKDLGRTLASVSLLIGQLPVARAKANMSVVVGQEVIDRFVAALGHINQAMGAAVEGHNHLEQTRRALRLPEMGGGDKDIIPNVAQAADQVSDDHGRMTG